MMMKRTCTTLLLILLTISISSTASAQSASFNGVQFFETFDGDPAEPTNWQSPDWDISTHLRSRDHYYETFEMQADHGADCDPPPNSHPVTTHEGAVYNCKNHLMTATNAPGYGVIYMTPRYLADFTDGEALVQFDLSTLRQSGRDWVDIWLTPFEDQVQNPLQDFPDLQGPPKRAIQFRMNLIRSNSRFRGYRFDDHQVTELDGTGDSWRGYEYFLTPDARRRDTFELRISKTHVTFGMPGYDFYWFDEDLNELDWTQAVVQLGHHSYNPTKDCNYDGTCGPGTWHWDNVQIEPAVPYTMIKADKRFLDEANGTSLSFDEPAPANSFLRFSAIGNDMEFSVDNGSTWQLANKQSQLEDVEGHFSSYFTPIDEGVSEIRLRSSDWWGGPWHARNFTIVSEEIELPLPIELSDFNARVDEQDVELSWTTLSETNNSGFFIEMKPDASEFEELGFVQGSGNTESSSNYSYRVEDLNPGSYTFRLRQVDFSGEESYSDEVEVSIDFSQEFRLSHAYPNPFKESTRITFGVQNNQSARLELTDKLGRVVAVLFEGEILAGETKTVDLNRVDLAAGTYYYRAIGSDFVSETRTITLTR